MDLLAGHLGPDREFVERTFMIGIMSLAETLLSLPLVVIELALPVADEVNVDLLRRKGDRGQLLKLCALLEAGHPTMVLGQ